MRVRDLHFPYAPPLPPLSSPPHDPWAAPAPAPWVPGPNRHGGGDVTVFRNLGPCEKILSLEERR